VGVSAVGEIYERFNARDMEGCLALLSDDFVLEDVAAGLTFNGPEGFREWVEPFLRAMPDSSTEVTSVVDAGEWVATEHTGRGTHTGPLATPGGEIPATGRSVEIRFGEFFRLRDGKIAMLRAYYDTAGIMRQLGVDG
jgi:steroid delta-isomerase-like uncharacterized protein